MNVMWGIGCRFTIFGASGLPQPCQNSSEEPTIVMAVGHAYHPMQMWLQISPKYRQDEMWGKQGDCRASQPFPLAPCCLTTRGVVQGLCSGGNEQWLFHCPQKTAAMLELGP